MPEKTARVAWDSIPVLNTPNTAQPLAVEEFERQVGLAMGLTGYNQTPSILGLERTR